jgi:ABC-type arginine/histidine transport system permease subunit
MKKKVLDTLDTIAVFIIAAVLVVCIFMVLGYCMIQLERFWSSL